MQKDENVGKEYIEQIDRFVGEILGIGDIDEEKKTCRKDLGEEIYVDCGNLIRIRNKWLSLIE